MKTRLFLLLAVTAVLVAVPAAAHGTNLHAMSNSQSFPDSIGENPNAPDITSVDVSNDDAGNITFKINISNRPALTSDMEIDMLLNTDGSTTTGDTDDLGADYIIVLDAGSVVLGQWSNTDYIVAPNQTTLTYSYDTTGATIHINASDLGGTKSISFGVIAVSGIAVDANGNPDDTNSQADYAPDLGHGFYTYAVITKLSLTQTAFTTVPNPARSGKTLAASLAATESDTNGPIATGTITCPATVGGKRLPATHKLANGVATCFWKVPKTAKGKTFRGTVNIVVQGTTLTKTFAVKVH